jgi:hypothetical protein
MLARYSNTGDLIGDAPGASGSGSLAFSLVSQPQQVWQIQVSINPTTWYSLGTVTNGSGGLRFSDPTIGQASARFYRAVPLP